MIIKIKRNQWFIEYGNTFYYFPRYKLALEFLNKLLVKNNKLIHIDSAR